MTKIKRLLALALALCMALSLCACGDKEQPAPVPDPAPVDPAPAPAPDPDPGVQPQPDTPALPTPTPDPKPVNPDAPGYNTNDSGTTEKVEPTPTPEPEQPANADGAKCQVCQSYLTDWEAVDPVCGTVVGYERLCPKCQVKYTREQMQWHTLENGVCTACGKTESDPAKLQFKLNEGGTGYDLIRVTFEHHDPDLIIPRMYQGLPVTGVKTLTVDRQDSLQPYYIYLPDTVTELSEQAFRNLKRIRAVWMPDSLKTLGAQAFQNCQALQYLHFGAGLEQIGTYAFLATAVTGLELPAGLKQIGTGAFMSCAGLEWVEFNQGLRCIGEAAFAKCTGLKRLELPDSLELLLPNAFGYCSALESVNIPEQVDFIPGSCFYKCSALAEVVWHDGIRVIDSSAFNGTAITELPEIPALRTLGLYAFTDCRALTTVTLPEGMIYIGPEAFTDCSALATLNLPSTLLRVGESAFFNCKALPADVFDFMSAAPEYHSPDGRVCSQGHTLADWVHTSGRILTCHDSVIYVRFCPYCGETMPRIEFKWHNMVNDVCTDCGVTATAADQLQFELNAAGTGYIFTGVVNSYSSDTLIIPSVYQGLPVTEVKAFGEPSNNWYTLRTVYVPEGVTVLHKGAAKGCNLYNLYLPDSLTQIPDSLCTGSNAKYLGNLRLGSGVTAIGNYAFNGGALTELALPDSLVSLGKGAFQGQNGLVSVKLPQGLKQIGDSAFSGCKSLRYVTWPASLDYLGENAFSGTALGNLWLPPVAQMGEGAFYNCTKLTYVELANGTTALGEGAFRRCSALKTVWLPDTLTAIGRMAFEDCSALAEVHMPQGVTLGDGAFHDTPLADQYK